MLTKIHLILKASCKRRHSKGVMMLEYTLVLALLAVVYMNMIPVLVADYIEVFDRIEEALTI